MTDQGEAARARTGRLLDRIRAESERAEQEILEAEPPKAEVLERWVILRDFEDRLRRSAPRPVAASWTAFVLGTVAFVALLQWMRCNQTEFSARLVVSAVDIEAANDGDIEFPRKPSSVTATGFESLEIPSSSGVLVAVAGTQGAPLELRMLPDSAAKLTLKPIHAVDGTTLGMSFVGPGAVALRVGSTITDFQASLLHKVELRTPEERTEFDYSDSVAVVGRLSREFVIDVMAESWDRCVVCTPIRVRATRFVEERRDSGLDAVRELSAIRGGKVYFPAVGAERELRKGEALQLSFPQKAIAELVSLSAQADEELFDLELHGVADVVKVGSMSNPVDLRPTWLEWLRSRHGPALVWASCAWIFGAIAIARKWSRPELE